MMAAERWEPTPLYRERDGELEARIEAHDRAASVSWARRLVTGQLPGLYSAEVWRGALDALVREDERCPEQWDAEQWATAHAARLVRVGVFKSWRAEGPGSVLGLAVIGAEAYHAHRDVLPWARGAAVEFVVGDGGRVLAARPVEPWEGD